MREQLFRSGKKEAEKEAEQTKGNVATFEDHKNRVRMRQQRIRLLTRAPPGDVVPDTGSWECDGGVLVRRAGALSAIPAEQPSGTTHNERLEKRKEQYHLEKVMPITQLQAMDKEDAEGTLLQWDRTLLQWQWTTDRTLLQGTHQ